MSHYIVSLSLIHEMVFVDVRDIKFVHLTDLQEYENENETKYK